MVSRRMTVSQALVEFLSNQWTVDGTHRERTIGGVIGIFGHGNVAGIGQALLQHRAEHPGSLPYYQARNEQAMVHQACGYARMHRRLGTLASTASVGPGATNMLTGAALATTNRLPALLLPSDTFATRTADPVLQQLELPHDSGVTVNDAFRPLSRYFDRVQRPEQLFSIALHAMRVLTDPSETGAVTISLPEDVQAEALDVPEEFLAEREWHLRRTVPVPSELSRAIQVIRAARRPMIIAGGGVIYSSAENELAAFAEATGIPVGTTQAGGGSLSWDHPQYLGGVGATGSAASNAWAAQADVIIGIGTRYSDFTTASRTAFQNPNVVFININIAAFDAYKHGAAYPVVADARETLVGLREALVDVNRYAVTDELVREYAKSKALWNADVDRSLAGSNSSLPGQPELIGAIHAASAPEDVIVQAAGSLPGDLHKLWRVRDPLGYHVEYAFSCMGYEIAGGLGVKRGLIAAGDERDVIVMVGDGSYLMLHTELLTAVAERLKIIVIIVQNHGYASIGHLSETVGSERFGTKYRSLDAAGLSFETGSPLPVDLAANARSYGVDVVEIAAASGASEMLRAAVVAAKLSDRTTVIHVNSDPLIYAPDNGAWWEVPVAEISTLPSTQDARKSYEERRKAQRPLLG